MSRKLTLFVVFSSLIFAVLYPEQVADCVRQTLVLWYQNVLPALLPALFAVHLLLGCNLTVKHTELLCLLIGITCGFPLGCYCVCEEIRKGKLSKEKGQLYAAAFNQFSPVFLASYVATSMLKIPVKGVFFLLYASHLIPFLPFYYIAGRKKQTYYRNTEQQEVRLEKLSFFAMLDQAIVKSSDTLVKIGGYMLTCSILRIMLQRILSDSILLILLCGLLETTSGIAYLTQSCNNSFLIKMLGLVFASFGGVCGFLQVSRQLELTGLKKSFYVGFKVTAGAVTALLCFLVSTLPDIF